MKPVKTPTPVAILLSSLLFVCIGARVYGQSAESQPAASSEGKREEAIELEALSVTSSTRTERAVDRIPGSVLAIPSDTLVRVQLSSLDPNQMLAQTIPGYTASMDDLTTSGELLRGKRPQFFLDGVLMSTPLRDIGRMSAGMVDPSLIERIEVINGASAIEGLGGSGGMINYITKTPTKEGVVTEINGAMETQLQSYYIGWKATLLTKIKRQNWDVLLSLGAQNRPMYYDARGNLEYINTNGSYEDSRARSINLKLGYNFGANNAQRVQLYFNDYDLVGNNDYSSLLPGNRAAGIVITARRGPNPGTAFENRMRVGMLSYSHGNLLGGTFKAIAYDSREFLPNSGVIDPSKQDPAFAPIGTLVDASSITSQKNGLKAYWVRNDFLTDGLVFNVGYDFTEDRSYQNLILTNRTWLPEMHFQANSVYTQLSYDRGPVTLSAGARYQDGSIDVPTFRTLYMTAPATNGVVFNGGSKSYSTSVYNLGAVYRFNSMWSTFVGFTQGYDLPDIGTVIRNTNRPGQSIATVAEVDPVLTDNYEAGINWRTKRAAVGVAVYHAKSPASTQVVTDPTTNLQTVSRNPQKRKGVELSAQWRFNPQFKISGTYSRMVAFTSTSPGLPVDVHITPASAVGESPDKAVLRLDWTPTKKISVDLVGSHFWGQSLNQDRAASLRWTATAYSIVNSSISYRTESLGSIALGVSNLTNTWHIVNENGTSNTNYYSIQGRKYTVTYSITF